MKRIRRSKLSYIAEAFRTPLQALTEGIFGKQQELFLDINEKLKPEQVYFSPVQNGISIQMTKGTFDWFCLRVAFKKLLPYIRKDNLENKYFLDYDNVRLLKLA